MKKNIIIQTLSVILVTSLVGCATREHGTQSANIDPAAVLAPLPETVTSFGAVTANGWLYAFGGHKGDRHDYYSEMVSGTFQRLKLSDGHAWEMLPSATPGQGQPLVAHNGYIYRIGGMAARNKESEKQDLYSLALVQRFDPKRSVWEDCESLPASRSSHDAVVLGDKLYVAGGWQLFGGTNKPVWPDHGLVLDLRKPGAGWKEFPQPFQRRALALAGLGSRVFCIGGMDSNNQPTLAVDIYDTASGEWSKGPALPEGKFKGFSCSAIAQDGKIYVTAFQGDLLRLSADGQKWEVVGRLERPRMAHRLVTAGQTQLIALGGEDGEDKTPDLEVLTPKSMALAATPVGETALLVVAHGAPRGTWNERVERMVEQLNWNGPKGAAFLTTTNPGNGLAAVAARLDATGVRRIIMVPLFVSSFSGHFEEVRYYAGERTEVPDHAEAPPLKTKAHIFLTTAMDDHPLISRILADQLKPISTEPQKETLVLVAHGPNEEGENQQWLKHLRTHAERLQKEFGFKNVVAATLRDDAPPAIREAATEELRKTVTEASVNSRVLVLPVLVSVGHMQQEVRERLKGTSYVMVEGGIANHPLAAEWVRDRALNSVQNEPLHANR